MTDRDFQAEGEVKRKREAIGATEEERNILNRFRILMLRRDHRLIGSRQRSKMDIHEEK